jgi:mRNA interferase RelE/StbE
MTKPAQYAIRVTPSAEKDIEKLKGQIHIKDYQRIDEAVRSLAGEPRPKGVRKIRTRTADYRIRVGNYRIVYGVDDSDKIILILQVVRRSETTYS